MADPEPSTLPVADPWFVTRHVSEGVTLITEPHVHPLLRCNVWHVRGRDRDLVIDTSLGLVPIAHLVEHELGHPVLAVATHCHSDHVGGMSEFTDRAIHRVEAGVLAAAQETTLVSVHYGETVLGPYRDAGYDIPELLVDAVPVVGMAMIGEIERAPAHAHPRGRRHRRHRRPRVRGAAPSGSLAREHRSVGGEHRDPVLGRRGVRRPAAR